MRNAELKTVEKVRREGWQAKGEGRGKMDDGERIKVKWLIR